MSPRPTGTVTFLLTDIEQSTRRWDEQPEAMRLALAAHDLLLRDVVAAHEGWLFKHTGDGVIAAFESESAAVEAAAEAQRRLGLPVRMAVCTGAAELRDNDYFGPTLNRAARILAAAHAGQVLAAASTAAALTGYDLADLGEHRLRDLSQPERLYQVRAEGLARDFPPPRATALALGNLPSPATSLLGREKDLAGIAAQRRVARLLTLTGVGGVGKTRLALQAAADASPDYPDGVWLIELAAVGDPGAVGFAVAGVLGVSQQAGKSIEDSVVASLSARRLLLVLDNCEHLIDPVASLAQRLLKTCPRVTLLATSREALAIDGEQTWPVPSLGYREGEISPAVLLFVERARAVAPTFALGDDGAAVAEICRRLDGIPLAIELAAARIRSMSPTQIRDRLDERFRLLTGGPRRVLERHQTLRHAVQWSYGLLSPVEQATLARAAVFAGGFSLEAAERVCAGGPVEAFEILDTLDSLVRKSLVMVERTDAGIRYSLLETIRQFAEEELAALGETEAVRTRHAEYFARDADKHFAIWRGAKQLVAYEWLDREMSNLRVAFQWACDRGLADFAIRIAASVGDMARFRVRDEATHWAEQVVDSARKLRHPLLIVTLTWASSNAWSLSRLDAAKRYGNEALALSGDDAFYPLVWAHIDLALVSLYEGDVERAVTLIKAGAAHPSDGRDRMCRTLLPFILAIGGRSNEARAIVDSSIAAAEATGIPTSICNAYLAKGRAFAEVDPGVALAALEHGIAVARQSGNRFFEAIGLPHVASLQARSGDITMALGAFRQMTELWKRTSDQVFMATGLGELIVLLGRIGEPRPTATLYGALAQILPTSLLVAGLSDTVVRLQETLGKDAYDKATRAGASLPIGDVVAMSVEEIERALTAGRQRSD